MNALDSFSLSPKYCITVKKYVFVTVYSGSEITFIKGIIEGGKIQILIS